VAIASDKMTVSDEYRTKSAEFRAKADSEADPLFRSMFETLARTYSRLARHHDHGYRPKLVFRPSPPIAVVDPPKRKRRRAKAKSESWRTRTRAVAQISDPLGFEEGAV